ncbi:MAG: hypothetical protein ACK2VD_02420 [Anaerolineae bacterium]|jgi:hypothetical protein
MWLSIGVGAALLLLGRRLYWLFVAGAGFVIGATLSAELLQAESAWMRLLAAIAAGLVGLMLALFLQRVAIAIAGFIAGGYVLATLVNAFIGISTGLYWGLFVLGGIVGAILVSAIFGWALIILSSLMGAGFIAEVVPVTGPWDLLLYLGLAVVGIVVQAGLMRGGGKRAGRVRDI